MKYRFGGKERLLTFGTFPDMPLAEARQLRDEARRDLRDKVDPAAVKRQAAAEAALDGITFEAMARAWHVHQRPRWTPVHAGEVLAGLERDVFPAIGDKALAAIDVPMVLDLLRAVERRGCLETARRLRQRISAVFVLAMSEGKAMADPAAIVRKALAPSMGARRQPALLDLEDARALIAAADHADAVPVVKLASRFLALTAVRMACVRSAEWLEFENVDWDGEVIGPTLPVWRIPAAKLKLTVAKKSDVLNAHLVPLSREAVDVLRAVRTLSGRGRFVFPGANVGTRIGETAVGRLYAQTRFEGRHVPHGWRATFSTVLNERFPAQRALIDQALGHVAKDKVEAAYNRAAQLARRRTLFQAWGTMLMAGAVSPSALAASAAVKRR